MSPTVAFIGIWLAYKRMNYCSIWVSKMVFSLLNIHNGQLKQDHRLNELIVREKGADHMLSESSSPETRKRMC
jgi:hypothetical protein